LGLKRRYSTGLDIVGAGRADDLPVAISCPCGGRRRRWRGGRDRGQRGWRPARRPCRWPCPCGRYGRAGGRFAR